MENQESRYQELKALIEKLSTKLNDFILDFTKDYESNKATVHTKLEQIFNYMQNNTNRRNNISLELFKSAITIVVGVILGKNL
jgi:hypothetical protein